MAGVKIKELTMRIFYKFLLHIKPRYNGCHLQKKINKKIRQNLTCKKTRYLIGRPRKNSSYPSFDFPEANRSSKWRFDYCGTWANFTQVKLVKIAPLRTLFGQKLGQHGLHPKWSSIFLWKYQNEIISSQELFISSKYRKFWLSYEWFFDLCNILLPKPAISGWKDVKDMICG